MWHVMWMGEVVGSTTFIMGVHHTVCICMLHMAAVKADHFSVSSP
jgi:hypothetical protein